MSFTAGSDEVRAVWDATLRASVPPAGFPGDADWIFEHVQSESLFDLYPGQIVSLKVHARNGPPEGARLVCGHGDPRFSDPAAGWAHRAWKEVVYGPSPVA